MRPLQSTYFKVADFRCRDKTPYPEMWVDSRLQLLCTILDTIRSRWGGPIIVVSGYRSPAWNARKGGKPLSQHVQGRAADIAPKNATPELVARLFDQIRGLLTDGKLLMLGGLGEYPGWVHVDCRPRPPDGHLARWHGTGFGSELIT